MNKQIDAIARNLRRVLTDDELTLCEIDREALEDIYIGLERIAIREKPRGVTIEATEAIKQEAPVESETVYKPPF